MTALSAILVDAASGQVLYEKDADTQRPPASTTKIMTSIMLLEKVPMGAMITASKAASDTGGSGLGLKPGETLSAHDMLYGLLLRSANDGCVAVAEHVAGTEARFAEMMTRRAAEIGATHSLFRNSNGLNTPPNLTTARDLATLACFASRFPEFREATRTKVARVARAMGNKDTVLVNHAKWLWRYQGADGVKTGYTAPAGRCFVGGATRGDWRLISVVLNCQEMYEATAALMDYGFAAFEPVIPVRKGAVLGTAPVRGGDLTAVDAVAADDVRCAAPKGRSGDVRVVTRFMPQTAPVASGAAVGAIDLVLDGRVVVTRPLVARIAVPHSATAGISGVVRFFLLVAALGTIGVGYATHTKSARGRGYRFKENVRGVRRSG